MIEMLLKVAVAEDEQANRNHIENCLRRFEEEQGIKIELDLFASASEMLEGFTPRYDVIFLDIMMPGINGMKAAKKIRTIDQQVILVFITNIAQYAIKGYEVGALDFILKPLSYESFAMKLARIVKQVEKNTDKSIVLTVNDELRKISVSELYYVEVVNHQLIYHLAEEEIRCRGSLKSVEESLTEFGFTKCNSGYLVNLQHVRAIKENFVTVGPYSLQISRARKKEFAQKVADYIGGI
jgi:DNA-binding LytR/AlgR family response regulator